MAKSLISVTLHTAKCGCEKCAKGIKRVAKSGCPNDDDAIAALPDDWIPQHSGPILTNYLKQREQDHQSINEDIIKCAADINHDSDEKIRARAEKLLAHIYQSQLDIDCVVQNCGELAMGIIKKDRDSALKQINELSMQRIDDMTSFKRDASAIEKERADNLKNMMREKFQRLIAIGHMTPKDLLHNFDERIYEINQQLLSNSRAFTELEAQLRVQLEESIVRARSRLNQLLLGIEVVYRGRNSINLRRDSKDLKPARRRSFSAGREGSGTSIGRSFLGDVEELDACVARVVQAYRARVLKVYTGFCNKLNNLERDLYSHQVYGDHHLLPMFEFADFQKLIERPLRRLSLINNRNATSKTLLEITGADVISMQKSLWTLGECLQNTYSILHHAGHLWDAHMLRSALAQKLTMCAVEDLITSHDAVELANEIQLSIAIEQLRCSQDADKLQQLYEPIITMLDKTAEMYFQHSESEVGRLEEFMNLPTSLANTLLSEFDLFLEKYPRSVSTNDDLVTPPAASPKRNHSYFRLPLPRAILQTEVQGLALKNWRNGFLESFEGNISLVPEELRRQAQLWVEERCTSLHMRYSLKIVSHNIRVERVKAARDVRLAELRHHEARLESHLLAVYDLVESLPVEASQFAAIDAPFLYPLVKWVDHIAASVHELLSRETFNPEYKKLKMCSFAPRIPKYRRLFEESLDVAVAEYKLHLEHRVQEARISNIRFMSNIKLFNEGGRYASQEAIKTSMALTKASEALELCGNKALEALNHRRNQLLVSADNQLQPVLRMVDDVSKLTSKSTTKQQDRRAGKKK